MGTEPTFDELAWGLYWAVRNKEPREEIERIGLQLIELYPEQADLLQLFLDTENAMHGD